MPGQHDVVQPGPSRVARRRLRAHAGARAWGLWLALWLSVWLCASAQAQEPAATGACLAGNCVPPQSVPSSDPRAPGPTVPPPAVEASAPTTPATVTPPVSPPPPPPLQASALPPLPPCVARNCTVRSSQADAMLQKLASPPPRQANVARGVAIFGVFSAALILSGSIVLGTQDSVQGERIGRGLMLGLNVVSTPIIAISTLVVRRQLRIKGLPALRRSFWAFYLAAVVTDSLYLHRALHDDQVPLGLSIAAGATSAVAVLGYAYDAFITARQARLRGFALGVGPQGARLRLQF